MANSIIIHKKGLKKDLPVLQTGESAWTTDEKGFYIGNDDGNVRINPEPDTELSEESNNAVSNAAVTKAFKVISEMREELQGIRDELYEKADKPEPEITISNTSFAYNTPANLGACATANAALSYKAAEGYEDKVSVDAEGNVTGLAVGTAKILISAAATDSCKKLENVEFTITVNKAAPVIIASDMTIMATQVLPAGASSNSGGAFTYSIANKNIAKADRSGNITGVAVGSTTMTITVAATANYTSGSVTVNITVVEFAEGEAVPVITADDIALTYGGSARINASVNSGGTLTYTSSNTKVARISESNGTVTVTALSVGTAVITINAAATVEYRAGSKDITVTVSEATPVITAPDDLNVTLNGTASLHASANSAGDITYTSLDTAVATVDSSGTVTGVALGDADIVVHAAAIGGFSAGDKTVHVHVVSSAV